MAEKHLIHPKLASAVAEVPPALQERLAEAMPQLMALLEALSPSAMGDAAAAVTLLEGLEESGRLKPRTTSLKRRRLPPPEAQPMHDQVQDRGKPESDHPPGYRSSTRR
jgi:hypothetical protein